MLWKLWFQKWWFTGSVCLITVGATTYYITIFRQSPVHSVVIATLLSGFMTLLAVAVINLTLLWPSYIETLDYLRSLLPTYANLVFKPILDNNGEMVARGIMIAYSLIEKLKSIDTSNSGVVFKVKTFGHRFKTKEDLLIAYLNYLYTMSWYSDGGMIPIPAIKKILEVRGWGHIVERVDKDITLNSITLRFTPERIFPLQFALFNLSNDVIGHMDAPYPNDMLSEIHYQMIKDGVIRRITKINKFLVISGWRLKVMLIGFAVELLGLTIILNLTDSKSLIVLQNILVVFGMWLVCFIILGLENISSIQ